MIKGAQKQMIVLRTGDSRYFDEAYFVLRREIRTHRGIKNDILREANRILEETATPSAKVDTNVCRGTRRRGWLLFGAGVLLGVGAAIGVLLLI